MGNNSSDIEHPRPPTTVTDSQQAFTPGFMSDRPASRSLSSREQSERLAQLSHRYKLNNTTSHVHLNGGRSIIVILEGCTTMMIALPDSGFTSTWLNGQFLRKCRDIDRPTDGMDDLMKDSFALRARARII